MSKRLHPNIKTPNKYLEKNIENKNKTSRGEITQINKINGAILTTWNVFCNDREQGKFKGELAKIKIDRFVFFSIYPGGFRWMPKHLKQTQSHESTRN